MIRVTAPETKNAPAAWADAFSIPCLMMMTIKCLTHTSVLSNVAVVKVKIIGFSFSSFDIERSLVLQTGAEAM